ncbi:MAG: DUF2934 domain-containing protein [Gemmatimonadaceae bacterium]
MKESEKRAVSAVGREDTTHRADPREIQTPASGGAAAEEQIRIRAYELFRERGGKVGDDMADWFRAQREYLERAPSATAGEPAHPASSHAPAETTA